jgi:hypothetical protein
MTDNSLSYKTPCEAIRVFCGFPRPELSEAKFFEQLGRTFMPGTPYMLQPLGLAAYLPGALSNPAPNLPREFALICYPSPEVWSNAMNGTLRGRVYNQTHGGVYALPPSGAAFPVFIDNLPATAVDPFFLFQPAIDWQSGVTHVLIGAKAGTQSGQEFRTALRNALISQREVLTTGGVDQVIVTTRDDFAIIWLHGTADELSVGPDFLSTIITGQTLLKNERVICVDEPPTLNITTSSAYNFIFLRESKYFLK